MMDANVEPEEGAETEEPAGLELGGIDFYAKVERGAGLTPAALEKLQSDPGFLKHLDEYDPTAGRTRRESVESGLAGYNADPLCCAIRGFQAAKVAAAAAATPPKPVFTPAEYKSRAEALVKQGAHRPEVAKQLQELKAAQNEGRIR